MKVHVRLEREDEVVTVELSEHATIEDLLKKLGLYADMYVPVINNKVVPIDLKLAPNAHIRLIKVISGG